MSIAFASPASRPATGDVSLRIPAGSLVAISNVAWSHGNAWFALSVNGRLGMYRWRRRAWKLDGTVTVPREMPEPAAASGTLRFTSMTGGDAPDFTVHVWGADTAWFAMAARSRGRWRMVPFDDPFGRRHAFTFAYGAEHHLIHGALDACGCASGPTTEQWYRLADGVFVATAPPGMQADCSAHALANARHWPPLPYDPIVREVARPFRVVRFACADGWALATDGRTLAVYEQPHGKRWLRVGLAAPSLIGSRTEFAMPRSLLDRLARRIAVEVPPAQPEPSFPRSSLPTRWERAPITVQLHPGDVLSSSGLYDGSPRLLTLTITSRTFRTRVIRFRWRDGEWVRVG